MLAEKLQEAAGNGIASTLYVDDVFSTYLYTGNGSTQTITNGIDLAGQGGMTWIKSRSAATDHKLTDTVRGATKALISDTTGAQTTDANGLTAFSSTGFSIGTDSVYNTNAATYASWTFRKAAKFFDVVTYTGDGSSSKIINHNLDCMPGMIIIKCTSQSGDNWVTCSRLLDVSYIGGNGANTWAINSTSPAGAGVDPAVRGITTASFDAAKLSGTAASFEINKGNANGSTYVAYIFAHNPAADGFIQCGYYSGNGNTKGPTVTLGWEPQYLMIKNADVASNWQVIDSMRGMPVGSADATLQANLSNAESNIDYVSPTATGFQITSTSTEVNTSGATYIYMAIRRPNKPPTSGTQVFVPQTYAGNDTSTRSLTGLSFPPDLGILFDRGRDGLTYTPWSDRLRGGKAFVESNNTNIETAGTTNGIQSFDQNGITIASQASWNNSTYVSDGLWYAFKRAPGFMDVVCYTGTGSATTQAHNLTVVPELIIVKERSAANDWWVYNVTVGNTKYSILNSTAIPVTSSTAWNNTTPTSSVFSIGTGANVNASTQTYVAYLFATLAGISKVGSYTGNGGTQNIDCGFAAGARFFLVKATSTTGSWWVWDSARGIVAGNDPALQLNSTAAEITTADAVDPYSPGITVNQEATCSINASGVSYVYLAIS